ncbi:MAG: ATP-dependent protease, partial [bacterium]
PAQNTVNLMLSEEVVQAVRSGDFQIWAVRTVDEGLEVLTGVPSGEPSPSGKYPEGTTNYRVSRRLTELSDRLRRFTPVPRGGDGKDEDKADKGKEK